MEENLFIKSAQTAKTKNINVLIEIEDRVRHIQELLEINKTSWEMSNQYSDKYVPLHL